MIMIVPVLIIVARSVTWLLDFIVVLIFIRAVCSLGHVPWLTEFNEAGKPLVDRAIRNTSDCWRRLVPNRPIGGIRLLLLTALIFSLLGWSIESLICNGDVLKPN